eukprot:CAMPEP_0177787108 /NCGR_PEP_ID=MMETSP0491_2-20121128/21293_1 /TAXON_ID=63592 /ORGANISM="Tetraselmis chuii, Strain PLY429" /LENGTH=151 /DNA_ID=CAMNT_0019308389 /DNA_START=164 /DNA_END=619 /DNA_ORIENTATION=+
MSVSVSAASCSRVTVASRRHSTPLTIKSQSLTGTPLPRTFRHIPARRDVGHVPRRNVVRMGLFGLGVPEIAVIAGVAAVLFGPSKLPDLGKGLGRTVKSFQTAAKEFESELKTELKDEEKEGKLEGEKEKEAAAKVEEGEKKVEEKKVEEK